MRFLGKQAQFSVQLVIAVIVGIIMLIAVAVPITQDVVTDANLTGTDATIANILVTLIIVGGIVLVTRLYS